MNPKISLERREYQNTVYQNFLDCTKRNHLSIKNFDKIIITSTKNFDRLDTAKIEIPIKKNALEAFLSMLPQFNNRGSEDVLRNIYIKNKNSEIQDYTIYEIFSIFTNFTDKILKAEDVLAAYETIFGSYGLCHTPSRNCRLEFLDSKHKKVLYFYSKLMDTDYYNTFSVSKYNEPYNFKTAEGTDYQKAINTLLMTFAEIEGKIKECAFLCS